MLAASVHLYHKETNKFMRQSSGRSITRYDVCSLACNVYEHALSPSNLRASFKRTGIHPFCPTVVGESLTAPSLSYIVESLMQRNEQEESAPDCRGDCRVNLKTTPSGSNGNEQTADPCAKF